MAEPVGTSATAVERAFRAESGRALATIARLTGDIDLAEEAVQDAFVAALRHWPAAGVPENPGAWITTTARNRALDVLRRESTRPTRETAAMTGALESTPPIVHAVADDELLLMFTCCHPSLAPETRVALTLRMVSGLRVPEIARALLQREEAVAKRLQRAKAKIRGAAIPLRVPPAERLGERVAAVAECIYLTFTEGYAATAGDDLVRHELCDEAIRLGRHLVDVASGDPAAEALVALMLLQDSRRRARLDADGGIVLLADQDRTAWDRERIAEGLTWLDRARAHDHMTAGAASYLLQAAIAAEHARAPSWDATDWPAIVHIYDELLALTASPVVELNRCVAVSYADGPDVALAELARLAEHPALARSHLLHAATADATARLGRTDEAADHYRRAIELAGTEPERAHLRRQLDRLAPQ